MRFQIAAVVLVVFGCSFTTLGQERKISEEDLKQLISIAADKRKGVSQRQKVSTTGYGADDRSETIYELGPNDTFHVASTRKVNGVETKTENIRIGTTRYTRQKDGTWTRDEPRQGGSGQGSGLGGGSGSGVSPGNVDVTTEHLFLGTENIDKQKTNHYRIKRKITFLSATPVRTRLVTYDYWFREDGMLVRESNEDIFENSRQRYKTVTEYKYDKDIKIVAPIP